MVSRELLSYIYTMPNKHYSSKPTSLRYHLMAKRCLEVGRKSRSEEGTCLHGAVKVGWRALQSCWECSSVCYTPKQCQTSAISKPTSLVIECFYRIVHLHIAYFYEHSYKFDNLAIHLLWSLPSCIEIEPAAK